MRKVINVVVVGLIASGMGVVAEGGGRRNLEERSQSRDNRPAITRGTGRDAPARQASISSRTDPAPASTTNAARTGESRNHGRRDGHSRRVPVQQTVIVYNVISDDVATAEYINEQVDGFYRPGYDWGVLLKAHQIDWGGFVPYLQQYIVPASELGQDAFRRGFLAGFGASAAATYAHALRQAGQRS